MKELKVVVVCVLLLLSLAACGNNGQSQLPNPVVEYGSFEEAQKAVDFNFTPLGNLPAGFSVDSISVIDKRIAQIIYKKGDDRICYRVAKGGDDISGDYNEYPANNTVTMGENSVLLRGTGEKVNVALWEKDGFSFALSFNLGEEGMPFSDAEQIIVSVL